ncbi:MAG: hypothetical protein KGI80_04720 [Verrucomicrobiota bacterium]|nr:hypothetical protein [Verrucomicrobiota bacterium]
MTSNVATENLLIKSLPNQGQIASHQEWLALTSRVNDLGKKWQEAFRNKYDGDPMRVDALDEYIRAKMACVIHSLSIDIGKLESQCANRGTLAAKEAKVIEEINNIVYSVLSEDKLIQNVYANDQRKILNCYKTLKPELANQWLTLQDRLQRELEYQPPSFVEDLKTIKRCFVEKKPNEEEEPTEMPTYDEYMLQAPMSLPRRYGRSSSPGLSGIGPSINEKDSYLTREEKNKEEIARIESFIDRLVEESMKQDFEEEHEPKALPKNATDKGVFDV